MKSNQPARRPGLLPPSQLLRNVGLWRRRDPNLAQRTGVLAMMARTSTSIDNNGSDAEEQPMDDAELLD